MDNLGFSEYEDFVRRTAVYPDIGNNPVYPVLGLCGESGEVAEKIKKTIRDGGDLEGRTDILKELGDVLWCITMTAYELGFTLDDVVGSNVHKIKDRRERGVIHGEGDNR